MLGQLAAGRTDREIAESLFISKKTASVHVSNLLRKLDVANRVEAGKRRPGPRARLTASGRRRSGGARPGPGPGTVGPQPAEPGRTGGGDDSG